MFIIIVYKSCTYKLINLKTIRLKETTFLQNFNNNINNKIIMFIQ